MKREMIEFLLRAKKATYASDGDRVAPSRGCSQDLEYCEGEYKYYDTYLGGESFAGEEAVWKNGVPIWSMNYIGRVTGDNFSIVFLKEALLNVPFDKPFRGPECFEKDGYTYKMECVGDFSWFQGKEIISYNGKEIYECFFHGGNIK